MMQLIAKEHSSWASPSATPRFSSRMWWHEGVKNRYVEHHKNLHSVCSLVYKSFEKARGMQWQIHHRFTVLLLTYCQEILFCEIPALMSFRELCNIYPCCAVRCMIRFPREYEYNIAYMTAHPGLHQSHMLFIIIIIIIYPGRIQVGFRDREAIRKCSPSSNRSFSVSRWRG